MQKDNTKLAKKLAYAVADCGGRAYFVGGFVRDRLLGIENKDIDIEVHGITPEALEKIIDSLGDRIEIGKSFGVYSVKGYGIDIAMPRKEKAFGGGHRDFKIDVDPFIGVYKAALRRDFTVNALMQDILTDEITDCFGGKIDLENKILRHVNSKSFAEDPLRVLRGAQFASRFGFLVSTETMALFEKMETRALSAERVFGELEKALLKAEKPSVFFEVLRKCGQLEKIFPELFGLIGVKQPAKYHKEGDAYAHTMLMLDNAAEKRESAKNKIGFMLSALTHDFGKALTTTEKDGVIHSYRHETEGIPAVRDFLKRITNEKELIRYVLSNVSLHMKPNLLASVNSSVKATNKMFDMSVCPEDLILLAECDNASSISEGEYISYTPFLEERYKIYLEYMSRPFVSGKDLVDAGISPSGNFSEILDFAHTLRLSGVPKNDALKQTLQYAKKLLKASN